MIIVSRELREEEFAIKNKSFTYLYPLLNIKEKLPLNTYLFLNNDDTIRYELYCLFRYNKYNEDLKKNKNYLRTINIGDYDIFVFSCERFIPEYEYFIIGKYSKFRTLCKERILDRFSFLQRNKSIEVRKKYNKILGILYKTDLYKKELEQQYKREINDDEELSEPTVLKKETFNFYNEKR